MHVPGHIAIVLAQHRLLTFSGHNDIPLKPLLIATIFPDLVDKAIGYVFCLMPNGRHYAHNIFALVGLPLAVTLVWGKKAGLAWFLAYLGHLLADDISQIPWFFPVKRYQFYKGRLRFKPDQFLRESIFLIIVFAIYFLTRPLPPTTASK